MKIVGKFFAFIFSLIYCLVLTSFITLSYSTNLLKGEFYTKILNKVDFNEINVKVDNGQGELTEVPLKDLLVNGLTQTGIDEDTAVKIIENENINRIVGNLVGDMMNYQLNNGDIPEVSKEDIKSILNDPDINKDNATLTDEEINELHETINSFLNQIVLEGGFNNADTR